MQIKTTVKNQKKKKAFISIFAIFFSAIVVSVLTALYILLVKQIELMNLDNSSFQALYMADSAFECVLFKEQNKTGTDSVFFPNNPFGDCGLSGDSTWVSSPVTNASGRALSELKISMVTQQGDFCAYIKTDKQFADTSTQATAPPPNTMNISGQSRSCLDTSGTKIIERLIEFSF
jgi:hypothetical protein